MAISVADLLRSNPLLQDLEPAEVETLARHARIQDYPQGSYVFRESQPRRAFWILISGRVQIIKSARGRPEVLHLLSAGVVRRGEPAGRLPARHQRAGERGG